MADSTASGQPPTTFSTVSPARVDPPHVVSGGPDQDTAASRNPSPSLAAASNSPEAAAALVHQLRSQAGQLAGHLQLQQKDLDRREAEMNAREAGIASEMRAARLWLAGRQEELAERRAELDQQGVQIEARTRELARREAAQTSELDRKQSELESEKAEMLAALHRDVHDAAGESATDDHSSAEVTIQAAQLHRREQALETEQGKLQALEQELDEKQGELKRLFAELESRETADRERQQRIEKEQRELEGRHRELDQRQAQLYQDIEQACQSSAEVAGQKTLLEQLRGDLAADNLELDSRRQEVEQLQARLDSQRLELDRREADLEAQTDDLNVREQKLAARYKEVELAILRFERLGVTEQRMQELQEEASEFQNRKRYLDDAEALLAQQEADVAATRQRLDTDRDLHEDELRDEYRKLDERRNGVEAEIARRMQELHQRSDQLDLRQSALEEARKDVNRLQRETLEMRLATEELWAQLSGPLAPASLTRSLAQIRTKLADHYRGTEEQLDLRRAELEELASRLATRQEELLEQRHELEHWCEVRQEDVEKQAARLVAREQELDRQQTFYEEEERRWHEERRHLQHDVRQLLGKLRATECAAA